MAGQENAAILELANELWNFFEARIDEKLSNTMRYFRAVVIQNTGNNTLKVQRPFDPSAMTLPCVGSIANATAGTQVVVVMFGKGAAANSVVIGSNLLQNL